MVSVSLSIKSTQVSTLCCCVNRWTAILRYPGLVSCMNEHLIVDSVTSF